jgi:hypothetical protein
MIFSKKNSIFPFNPLFLLEITIYDPPKIINFVKQNTVLYLRIKNGTPNRL